MTDFKYEVGDILKGITNSELVLRVLGVGILTK